MDKSTLPKIKNLQTIQHSYIATRGLHGEPKDAWNPSNLSSQDIILLMSSETIGNDAIEMLAPRENTAVDDIDSDSEDENNKTGSKMVCAYDFDIHNTGLTKFMACTSLDFSISGSDNERNITSMSSNKSENLLVAGNSLGEILLFDLRRHPPSMVMFWSVMEVCMFGMQKLESRQTHIPLMGICDNADL